MGQQYRPAAVVEGSNLTLQWSTLQDQELFVMKGPFPKTQMKVQIQCPASESRDKHVCIRTLPTGDGSGSGSADEPYKVFQTCELLANGVKAEEDEFPTVFNSGSQMPSRGSITVTSVRVPPFQMTSRLRQAFGYGSVNRMISVGTSIVVLSVYLCCITVACHTLYIFMFVGTNQQLFSVLPLLSFPLIFFLLQTRDMYIS